MYRYYSSSPIAPRGSIERIKQDIAIMKWNNDPSMIRQIVINHARDTEKDPDKKRVLEKLAGHLQWERYREESKDKVRENRYREKWNEEWWREELLRRERAEMGVGGVWED